jgi:hypothetical protein
VSRVPKGENIAQTSCVIATTISHYRMEVGSGYNIFYSTLPRTMKQHDSIMVVVEKLIKVTHFNLVKTTHKEKNITYIYMK